MSPEESQRVCRALGMPDSASIDVDPAFAVVALKRAGVRCGAHSVEIGLPGPADPADPPASHWLVEIIWAGERSYMGEANTFAEAVAQALVAALPRLEKEKAT